MNENAFFDDLLLSYLYKKKKASTLDINIICSLHGPVLKENLNYYLDLYNTWSSYKAEEEGILISYCSMYGNTKQAVLELEAL